ASTSHTENTCFAKSTPMVIVLMETSSSADGYDHHGPRGRYDEEVSFYSVKRTAIPLRRLSAAYLVRETFSPDLPKRVYCISILLHER
ncbi:MAG: hypothetical protein ACREPH_00780, partial [Rhodanobacteraceae bacterium]